MPVLKGLMNRLKSKYRNRMSQSLLRDLMFIRANGPKLLKDLHVPLAIAKWKSNSKRGRYRKYWQEDLSLVVADMAREFRQVYSTH